MNTLLIATHSSLSYEGYTNLNLMIKYIVEM